MPEMKQLYIDILNYLDQSLAEDPVYDWILQETQRRGFPEIQITPLQGRLLQMLAQLLGACRVLEIGTLNGYSGVWIARGLPPDGKLITLEVNEKHADLAREVFRRAEVADKVEVHVGPALDTLANLELDAPLDMAFIDADKGNNRRYFDWAVEHMRPGGLVLVDNVLMNGRVLRADGSGTMHDIAAFNRYVMERFGEHTNVLPFFKVEEDNLDGVLMVRLPNDGVSQSC
jgi:predicted O-methyltransferase YrrM